MKLYKNIRIGILTIVMLGLGYVTTNAQDKPQGKEKSEATIGLAYYKNADNAKLAVATVKARNASGKFAPATNVYVTFYAQQGDQLIKLNSAVSDENGEARIKLNQELPKDDSLYFTIVAKIEKDAVFQDAEEKMHYKDVNFSMKMNPHDTARVITATVSALGKDGSEKPVKDVPVKFYVQRLFGTMPASDENTVSTDADGMVRFTIARNIPGDTAGGLTIVAKIEDNEAFGNVENKSVTYWGTVLAKDSDPFPRALWEPYAPMPLVITISTLFGGVWCVYFFLFVQMRKIKTQP